MIIGKTTGVYCGNIVIDKYLGITVVDDGFCQLVGDKLVGNLAKSTHPDYLVRLTEAVQSLGVGEPSVICYKIMTADGTYHNVAVKLFYEDKKAFSMGAIRAMFIDLTDTEIRGEENSRYINRLENYLEMMGGILFEYDRLDNYLIIFTGTRFNRIILHEGNLSEWEDVCRRLPVDTESRNALDRILEYVQGEHVNFTEFITFADDARKRLPTLPDFFAGQTVVVKGKLLVDAQTDIVQGYIAVNSNKESNAKTNLIESSMDSSLNIFNKKSITEYAKRQIEKGKEGYIAIIDLDNFKNVNDTYGHMFGDEVLATVASIMKDNIIGKGIVGRIGGDEFMIVIDRRCTHGDLRGIMRGIRSTVQYTYAEKGEGYNITVSIGVSDFGERIKTYEDAFKVADMMLYRAKEKGRNRYIIYEPDIHGNVLENGVIKEPVRESMDGKTMTKEQFMLTFFNLFSNKKTMSYSVAFQTLADVFGLDEILLFQGNVAKPRYYYGREHDASDRIGYFAGAEEFGRYYKDTNVAVINHSADMLGVCPFTYEFMEKYDYESMLVYKGKQKDNYIIMGRSSKSSRKWDAVDVSYLTFVSEIMDLELDNR